MLDGLHHEHDVETHGFLVWPVHGAENKGTP
jgi:hypothetical protein